MLSIPSIYNKRRELGIGPGALTSSLKRRFNAKPPAIIEANNNIMAPPSTVRPRKRRHETNTVPTPWDIFKKEFRKSLRKERRLLRGRNSYMLPPFYNRKYIKAVAKYFFSNIVHRDTVRKLIQELNTIWANVNETSDSESHSKCNSESDNKCNSESDSKCKSESDSSINMNSSDGNKTLMNLRMLTEEENYTNDLLTEDQKKALVSVTHTTLRTYINCNSSQRYRVLAELTNITKTLRPARFVL